MTRTEERRAAWSQAYSHARWSKAVIVLRDSHMPGTARNLDDDLMRMFGIDPATYAAAVSALVARQKADRLRLPMQLRKAGAKPMTRHSLEQKTVATLVNAPRRGQALIRARYIKGMQALGYNYDEAMQCYCDVCDVADLQRHAEDYGSTPSR